MERTEEGSSGGDGRGGQWRGRNRGPVEVTEEGASGEDGRGVQWRGRKRGPVEGTEEGASGGDGRGWEGDLHLLHTHHQLYR